jgi:hypothetical protein
LKKSVLFCLVVFCLMLGAESSIAQTTYDWVGGTVGASTDWNTPNNWKIGSTTATTAPGNNYTDIVRIGPATNQPVINSDVTANGIASLTVGDGIAICSLTLNASLSVGTFTSGTLMINKKSSLIIAGKTLGLDIRDEGGTYANSGTITGNAGSIINIGFHSGTAFTNNTGGSITLTGTTFNLNFSSISNSGTFTTLANSAFNFFFNSATITNNASATFSATATKFTMINEGQVITNTGGSFTATGCTFIFDGNGNPYNLINQNSTSPAVAGIMTLNGGTTVTLNSFSDISNTGTFNAGASGTLCTIFLTGSGSHILNTGTFNLGPTSIIYPTGTASSVTNTSPGVFTLQSDATGSAAIGAVGGSANGIYNVQRFITGVGTVANPLSNRGYRLLSSPVHQLVAATSSSSTFGLNYLNQNYPVVNPAYYGVYTTGPGGTGSGFSTTNNNATIYLYDESRAFNNQSFTLGNHAPVNAIVPVAGSNPATSTETVGGVSAPVPIPIGNGFLMYFVGSTAPPRVSATTSLPPDNATLTDIGYINQGSFKVNLWTTLPPATPAGTLSYTATPATSHPAAFVGFNMLGNPYPCTIDMTKVISDNSGINAIYVLSAKDSPNQFYIAYTANGASAPNMNYAQSGEGFMVHATATGKTLTFNESEKVPTGQLSGSASLLALRRPGASTTNSVATLAPQSNILTGLYMKLEKDSITYNYCGIYFSKAWSDKHAEDDAIDMNGTSGGVVMSSLSSDSIRLAVNHMSDYAKGINVKLYANASANGTYNLKIEGIRNIDTLYDIYLLDNYKKDSLDIRRYGTYIFDLNKSDTNSFGGNRFVLSIHPRPLPAYKLLSFTGQKVTTGVQLNWKTEAEGNYTGFVLQKADGTTFNSLYTKQSDSSGAYTYIDPNPVTGNNTYRLQQSDIVGNLSYSSPVTIVYNQSGATGAFSVYPNPAAESISINVITTTSNTTTSAYKLNIYNSAGQLVMQKSISSNTSTQDVTQYLPGTYVIQLTDNSGNLIGKSKFVKN